MNIQNISEPCELCPRMCKINRRMQTGYCMAPDTVIAARAALHHWEEPCISGFKGSGTVFFSGCSLRCRFCQNHQISSRIYGKELTAQHLSQIFLRLQEEGAHNINLVTATPYLPHIIQALDLSKHQLHIPIVFNTSGYERVETIYALKDYVDIWLPDLKYYSPVLSEQFSLTKDYFSIASASIAQMIQQTGPPCFHKEISLQGEERSIMECGVIIRHLVLPGHRDDSVQLLEWIRNNLPQGKFLISLLSQYTPYKKDADYPELNRSITSFEYNSVVNKAVDLGLDQGFIQKKSSAKEEYTPPFNLEGLL